ncbi:MAG: hypothetical protein ACE5JG_04960 [Planctomycetota bacterium]
MAQQTVTWDSRSLYESPAVGTCAITGSFETGRWFNRDGGRVFVGDSAQPDVVEDYVAFKTALETVGQYKRGYPKSAWTARRLEGRKPVRRK